MAASTLAIGMIGVALFAVPFGRLALGANPSFLPAFGAMTLLSDLLTGCLLLSQARLAKTRPPLQLAVAYLFSAMMIVPHLLSFPGVFAAEPVIGGSASAVWLWAAWHGGFAVLVLTFAISRPSPLRRADIARILGGLALVVSGTSVLATVGLPLLPTILVNGNYDRLTTLGIGPAILGVTALATILVAVRHRFRDPLSVWLAVAMLAATLDVTLTLFGGGRFTLGWYAARSLSLVTGVTVLAALLSDFVGQAGRVAQVNKQLELMLRTDVLTGVANRRAFESTLSAEWRRGRREQTEVSLLMIDIDLFKGFNDRYGHPAGDVCLRQVAAALEGQVQRPADLAARLGGEEFVLLLPNTDEIGAARVAERVRACVVALGLTHGGSALGYVTISIGVATSRPFDWSDSPDALIEAADQALYRAKAAGRNTVCTAGLSVPVLIAA
ncbi:sensor domain-containing diguanylate cyclase [Acidisphaera sp. L21]|uniref:sensor domain-containing diguanylate cyclase n=1 Tax=Acidisphaera sp. L21 TaxID=1641851 RepID=UPI00131CD63B|nr:sensor domain-containing diguanylate cyclase [Acidisphaera sp. L21]